MLPQVIAALLLAIPGAHASSMRARSACDTITAPIANGAGGVFMVSPGLNGRVAWTDATPTGRGFVVGNVFARDARGVTRAVGRGGAGPGEFRNISAMNWRGDTLWVSDGTLRRIQGFTEAGKFLVSRPATTRTGLTMRPGGTTVGIEEPAPVGGMRELGVGPFEVLATRSNGQTDTLLHIAPMAKSQDQYVIPELVQKQLIRKSADGEYWCTLGRTEAPGLAVSCADAAGKPALNGMQTWAARPTTEAVWEGAIAAMMKWGHGTTRASVTDFFHRPLLMPFAFDLLVNRNGDLWILRSHPSETKQVWARLRQNGTLLAPITVPGRVTLRALDGNWYYAADTDADDLQTLIRCVIP